MGLADTLAAKAAAAKKKALQAKQTTYYDATHPSQNPTPTKSVSNGKSNYGSAPYYAAPDWKAPEHTLYANDMAKLKAQAALASAPSLSAYPSSGGSGGGGGGYGGGYGGGGAGMDPAAYNAYAAQMMKVIQGMQATKLPTAPAAQQNPLTGMIDPAVDADIAAARGAYANIGSQISMDDPYLALIARQAPQMSPELQALANSQGVGADYGAQVALANQDAQNGAANWNSLAAVLGKNFLTGQQSAADTARLQGENIVQGYEGQRTQLSALAKVQQMQLDKAAADQAFQVQTQQAQLDAQNKQAQLQAIMELLGAGLPYGKTPDVSGVLQ